MSILKTTIDAALQAGKAILEIYHSGDFDIEIKGDNSPLTKADKASHNVIMSYLESTGIPVLSEEGKAIAYDERKEWNQLWIVDPIDGTKEFIKRNGEFTVNIALIEDQKPILGVIFVPAKGELYFSTKEMGAFKVTVDLELFDVDDLIHKASKIPFERDRKKFTIVASRSHMSRETEVYVQEMRDIHGEVNLISKGSSLKLCMVAEGEADCYPRFAPTMEWDTAAGQAICEHAGFEVIDWVTKKEMLYNRVELLNNWFLVKKKIKDYFNHQSAIIDENCVIGKETKIWHFSHIMSNCKVGNKCNIGQNVVISPNVILGDNVKVQNNVSIYTGVICEDDVFLGPSMVFTNVINPRSAVNRRNDYVSTIVKNGASIGANATIVCGNNIGKFSLVGAGAVVTKEVLDYSLVVGNPAKHIGWVSEYGHRLNFNDQGIGKCIESNQEYLLKNNRVKRIK
jgi:3'(2'), 5'-bisphosphate nucleotidase